MLTAFDKKLLNIIQTDLPIEKRPFEILAERLNSSEEFVIARLSYLKSNGYIRRIGPFFDSQKLGYVGTLAAVKVDHECLEKVAKEINKFPGVTHNYEREGKFNLWLALLTPTMAEREKVLDYIQGLPGVQSVISLPASRKFKVSVQFKLD